MPRLSGIGSCVSALALVFGGGAAAYGQESVIVPVELSEAPVVSAEAVKEMAVIGTRGERLGTLKEVAVDLGARNVRYGLVMPSRTGVGLKVVPFDAFILAYDPDTMRAEVEADMQSGNTDLYRVDADELIGRDVLNKAGEEISEVDDIVLTEGGEGPFVIMDVGGFLGIGDKQIAVPVRDFALVDEQLVLATDLNEDDMAAAPEFDPQEGQPIDPAESVVDLGRLEDSQNEAGNRDPLDLSDKVLALEMTEAQFEGAPMLQGGADVWVAQPAFEQQVEQYFESLTQQSGG